MLTGVYAARNILGGKYDVWSVNTEMAYHEEGRVTDASEQDRLVPGRVSSPVAEAQISSDEIIEAAFARLDPLALGVATGTVSGLGLFLVTAVLLLQDAPGVRLTLSLLGYYLIGFKVTWTGALIGLMEASVGGFALGYVGAWLRNWGMAAYASLVQQRAEAEARREFLDKV